MDDTIFIYKTNGFYFGFIRNGFLFSRDGIYMGWAEGNFIWDSKGKFRGAITPIGEYKYILNSRLSIPPLPRIPKAPPSQENPPAPKANIAPITISPEFSDGFNGS